MKHNVQMSETLLVGSLLAIVGGYVDVYTYLIRGGVFANAQTGNMVLLGMNAASGNWMGTIKYLIPILAFVFGVVLVEIIRNRWNRNEKIHWRQIVVALELIILAFTAFLPASVFDMMVNILISFVCSIQVQAFRKLNGNAYATTMCTGNLRSAVEQICNYGKSKNPDMLKNGIQYFMIILCFILGAVLGSFGCYFWKEKAVLLAAGMLLSVLVIMCFGRKMNR